MGTRAPGRSLLRQCEERTRTIHGIEIKEWGHKMEGWGGIVGQHDGVELK